MSKHANKAIVEHIHTSQKLVDEMNELAGKLQETLEKEFEKVMGCPLPGITLAMVRETNIDMLYSTDAKVGDYIDGARKILGAAFAEDKVAFTNGILGLVDVVVSGIIGTGKIQAGTHSTAARTGGYVAGVFAVVETASAKKWLTKADFFVCYYAFVVFRPATAQEARLAASPMLGAARAESAGAPVVDLKAVAARNYVYTPF